MSVAKYALDVSMLVRERPTGQARFVGELLKSLDATGRGGEFVVVLRKGADASKLPMLKDIKVVKFGFGRELIWHQTFFPLYAVLHHLTPISLANAAPLWKAGIVAFHDITYKTCAKAYKSTHGKLSMWWHRFQYWWCAHFAQRVLTVSEFSKSEYARVYHYPLDRIYPLFNGWEHMLEFGEDERVFERFPKIRKGEYYFVLGTLFEFKNIALAVRTAVRYPDTQFVITGSAMKSSSYLPEEHPNIIWTGYISGAVVKTLIKNAKALFFPSLSEGFGIPPLEALALGTPAIVSRASCLLGVYGDYVHWIDNPTAETPTHPDELLKTPVKSPEELLKKWSWPRLGPCFLAALDAKRVAVFVPRPLATGGVGVCIRNYLKHLDHSRYQLDFFVPEKSPPNAVVEEIAAAGGRVYSIPGVVNFVKYLYVVCKLLRRGRYDIAHVNMNTLSVLPLFASWWARIPVRISHAHSASHPQEHLRHFVKLMLSPFSHWFTTKLVACSEVAGEFQFGRRSMAKGEVTLLPNAIELLRFKFDAASREELRARYGLQGKLVIGCVGRLVKQKNPLFMIEVFAEVAKRSEEARLFWLGEGPLRGEVERRIAELGLGHKVILAGQQLDAYRYYSMFDAFCLPSLYEGFVIVLVEAQANGLRCVISTEITQQVNLSGNVRFLPLADSIRSWTDAILGNIVATQDREALSQSSIASLQLAGYDISHASSQLAALYG